MNACNYVCMYVGSICVCVPNQIFAPVVNEVRNLIYSNVEADYDIIPEKQTRDTPTYWVNCRKIPITIAINS